MRTLFSLVAVLLLCGCTALTGATSDPDSVTYQCRNGQTVRATYFPPDAARIRTNGQTIDMHIAISADGARYVGGNLTLWTKGAGPGSTATLLTYDPDTRKTGKRITMCTQVGG